MAREIYVTAPLKIQDWAPEDRPREKLLRQGASSLTDAELLAVLIGSGTRNTSVVVLAQHVLKTNGNSLQELAKRSVQELRRFRGIGEVKSIAIVCAMELTRRRPYEPAHKRELVNSSFKAYKLLQPDLTDKSVEEFWVLLLNRANYLIKKIKISSGGTSRTIVDSKFLFRLVLDHQTVSIVLAHNHPSGNTTPITTDIELTKSLTKAGELLDVTVLDHIIFTDRKYFSFSDGGML
ncbi:RadC family protein [Cardinium endosymbiont of Oedothorax gibbosus]|uniref:RadC family protein n=1 Tax=Cardinium endosymbiont of Oedothorax gibbosus TaxID=931101 RepID=UPI00202583A1|nr:DNA repair protein RadC [Cardinium endosymbiont of Oedothorax gibbosus]CAH2559643.1 Uncharacterised UPF0758 family protein [Cardinium endosymbiont of Oedothorax gibbosus]